MQAIYDLIVRALKPRLMHFNAEQAKLTFATWELIPIMRETTLVGVALRKEAELHIIIDPTYQNTICFLKQSKKIVAETIAKYSYAETKVTKSHIIGHRLAKILGFSETSSSDDVVCYKKE
jgi:hypothetical protein